MVGEVAYPDQHERDNVAVGFDKLQIITGIEPTSRCVDDRAHGFKVAGKAVVGIKGRRKENLGMFVMQVCGGGAQHVRDEIRPVALRLVEKKFVG